ncbi:MAG: PAS domain-containing protein [Pseudomonas sp.]|uniref:helix-turn-helix domain-containing protein n=1 Tax=Pseudomonas sp. TaxID=306 RepID=UPI0011FDB01E|nr:helix-turn-helix transcriptional regulator [Pseudomonas sp.]RZI74705.1 MAG: PAS domain-containing protein [Pseudomonas sp.]
MDPDTLISRSSVAAVVSDPRRPDNPIISCNEAFVALTGYSREQILGRNCRFLRGDGTEPEQTEVLREAISSKRPVIVELTNYRRDGSAFRNAVMVAPLFDEDGELIYFLGSQMAVDDGAAGQHQRAREQVDRISPRQKQILQALTRGQLNKQIAFDLGLTERTIKMHRAAVLRALGVKTVAEAIRIAIEAGY